MKFTFCMSDLQLREHSIRISEDFHNFSVNLDEKTNEHHPEFLKLRTEIENMTEYTKKKWPIQEVKLIKTA